jgi:uroporphyrinogen decarboxylase
MPDPIQPTVTRSEIESVLRCAAPRAIPPFLPALYEHKAWFIGSTPTAISRDPDLLTCGLLAEYEAIRPDALTIGIDIYNLEAEAAGCRVTFYEGDNSSIPGIKSGDHIIHVGDDLAGARIPNPRTDGRMPVNLAAARNVRHALGDGVWLRGAISGPFSLACSLVGADEVFMACLEEPDWVRTLLDYAGRIAREFARGYLDAGAEIVVFDSQASPDLLSPRMYEDLVLPITSDLIAWARTQGVRDVPLIIGGNTTSIAGALARTGANNLLCDFSADFDAWSAVARSEHRALRRNISPRLIATAAPDKIYDVTRDELRRGRDLPGFIMGTGVIPFGTPTEKVLAVREACRSTS